MRGIAGQKLIATVLAGIASLGGCVAVLARGGWMALLAAAGTVVIVCGLVCLTWLVTLRCFFKFAADNPRAMVRVGTLIECAPEGDEHQGRLFHLPPAANQ